MSERTTRPRLPKAVKSPAFLLFAALSCIGSVFALAQPPYGVSDEPAHAVKALATARLQLSGPEVLGQFDYPAIDYDVPLAYSSIWHMVCYSSNTDATPDCAPDFPSDRTVGPVSSTAGTYPPLYYFIVGQLGWPSPGLTGIISMRLASVVLNALVLTATFMALRRIASRTAATTAIFLGYTPTVLAMGSSVNPFGFEVSCFFLIWALASPMASHTTEIPRSNRRLVLLWIASLAVAFIRPMSFIWTLGIAAILAGLSRVSSRNQPGSAATRVRQDLTFALPLIVSACLSIAWWLIAAPGSSYGGSGQGFGALGRNLRYSFDRLDDYLLQLHSYFGWTEFYGPLFSLLLWIAAFVVFSTCHPFHKRLKMALLGLVALFVAAPLALEGARATSVGFGYQGRYILPLFVGLPVLVLTFQVRHYRESTKQSRTAFILVLVATLTSTIHLVRRYSVGLSGELLWFTESTSEPYAGTNLQMVLLMTGFGIPYLIARSE